MSQPLSLEQYIAKSIAESFKSALSQKALTEKEKQDATASNMQSSQQSDDSGDDDDFFGDSGDDSGEEQTSSKTVDDESEKLKTGAIEPKDIVDKLNTIRSGKSFRDSSVANTMEQYIKSLSKAEKVALMVFLKGIAQIVTGEVPAKNVPDPSEKPADVKMKKGTQSNSRHVEPNVIKNPVASEPKPQKGAEDTSAPAPITPKKR